MPAFLGSSGTPAEFSKLRNGIQISGDDITDGASNTIYDQQNNELKQDRLQNDSITFNSGNGIQSLSSTALGNAIQFDVKVSDFAGKFISDTGNGAIQVNLGRGLQEDSNSLDNIAINESTDFTFTSEIDLNSGAKLGANINANTNTIINLPDPINPQDVANRRFVEQSIQGLEIKQSSDVATNQNIDLTSTNDPRPIDGVTIDNGEIVLLKEQNDATENGLYVANTASDPTSWTRTEDFNNDVDASNGAFTFVERGTDNASTSFTVTTPNPISVGTDDIIFNQFTTAGEIIGGDGLGKSGRTLSINLSDFVTGDRGLRITSSDLAVDTGSSLEIDGSGKVGINLSNENTFTSIQNFNSGIDVGADISDGTTTIYDSSNSEIPDSVLGTIDNSTLASIQNSALSNSSITVNLNNGLSFSSGDGSIALGNNVDLEVSPGDFIKSSQLSINANGNIEIDDIFLSNSGDSVAGSFTFEDLVDLKPISEPSTPQASDTRLFVDTADNNLKAKTDDGSVLTIVNT